MAAKSPPPKRRNKTVQLGETIGGALDPALKRRGFANRDLLANWTSIAPSPWNTVARPDKLVWPRRDRPDPEGAILHLRCFEGYRLTLSHEGAAIAAAINRYFGYLLVGAVRLAPMPLEPAKTTPAPVSKQVSERALADLRSATAAIDDDGLRAALEKLGLGVIGKTKT